MGGRVSAQLLVFVSPSGTSGARGVADIDKILCGRPHREIAGRDYPHCRIAKGDRVRLASHQCKF